MPNSDAFRAGKYVILFIGLSKVFDLLTGINALILGNSKYYYFGLYFMFFLAAVAILLNYLLIPILNITGVAIATATSIFLYNSLLTSFVYSKLRIHPFTKNTMKVATFFAMVFVAHYFLQGFVTMWPWAIAETIVFLVIFLLFIQMVKPSEEIEATIKALRQKALGLFH
jgi:O-antigen/teichoic acid export membrane protein